MKRPFLFYTLRFILTLNFAIFTGLILSCGYVSTSSYLAHIKTINIAPVVIEDPDFFYDQTSGKPYDEIIRDALINRFKQKWSDGNDSQFDLKIRDYRLEPYRYDANNQPEQFRMSLEIEYEFKDRVQNKIIDRKDNHIQIHDFYVVSGRGEQPETREEAKARLIQELTDDLYSTLAEQW